MNRRCLVCSNVCFLFVFLAGGGNVLAAEHDLHRDGRAIFEKEWTFKAAPQLQQGELTRHQYEAKLRRQPGDGLGPDVQCNIV